VRTRPGLIFLLSGWIFFSPSAYGDAGEPCPVILNFHDVKPNSGHYGLTPEYFEKIVVTIKENNREIISFMDYYSFVLTRNARRNKAVVFTFDDGHPSVLNSVIPILDRHRSGATFFIYTDRYAEKSTFYVRLSKLPLKYEIGSHSLSHGDLVVALREDPARYYRELFLSRKKLEYNTGRKINTFAWPYGHYEAPMKESVFQAGYEFQLAAGILHRQKITNRICGRFTVKRETKIPEILRMINPESWE